jgi:hypothetical protein
LTLPLQTLGLPLTISPAEEPWPNSRIKMRTAPTLRNCLGHGASRRARIDGLSAQLLVMPSPFGGPAVSLLEDDANTVKACRGGREVALDPDADAGGSVNA